jgi:hypothetical protein
MSLARCLDETRVVAKEIPFLVIPTPALTNSAIFPGIETKLFTSVPYQTV